MLIRFPTHIGAAVLVAPVRILLALGQRADDRPRRVRRAGKLQCSPAEVGEVAA